MKPLERPFLEGQRIYLRGLLQGDLHGEYFSWLNDQEVCRANAHGRFPNTERKMQEYLDSTSRSPEDLILAIVEKGTDRHVGNISLQRINWLDRNAEFAILLGDKSVWGKGYASEAGLLILRHGFEALNLHRIYCGTSEVNVGMQKLAATLKMKPEGRHRQAVFKQGGYKDVLLYGVLREEFFS